MRFSSCCALIIFLLIILIYVFFIKKGKSKQINNSKPNESNINDSSPKYSNPNDSRTWNDLTMGEKVRYIADTYFNPYADDVGDDSQKKTDDDFIKNLDYDDTTCTDKFKDCSEWAENDECTINPEYMLYNCSKSCKACKLNDDEKYQLIKIYNTRPIDHCVYRGKEYPDNFQYLSKLYDYSISSTL